VTGLTAARWIRGSVGVVPTLVLAKIEVLPMLHCHSLHDVTHCYALRGFATWAHF
jgi:hypothetical protein